MLLKGQIVLFIGKSYRFELLKGQLYFLKRPIVLFDGKICTFQKIFRERRQIGHTSRVIEVSTFRITAADVGLFMNFFNIEHPEKVPSFCEGCRTVVHDHASPRLRPHSHSRACSRLSLQL